MIERIVGVSTINLFIIYNIKSACSPLTVIHVLSPLSDNMLLLGVLLISSGALCAPSDAVEVGVCNGDGCSALKSSIGAIEVIL